MDILSTEWLEKKSPLMLAFWCFLSSCENLTKPDLVCLFVFQLLNIAELFYCTNFKIFINYCLYFSFLSV